jgi:hypothetical protein
MDFAIADGNKTNKYLSSTHINFIVTSVWFVIRGAFDSGMIAAARGANDIGMSTLILLGGVGTFAGFHLDWTEACNVAFSVGATPVAADSLLAVWVSINPLLVEAADAWIKKSALNTKRKGVGADREHVYRWPNGLPLLPKTVCTLRVMICTFSKPTWSSWVCSVVSEILWWN